MNNKETCDKCRFSHTGTQKLAECRKNAPQTIIIDDDYYRNETKIMGITVKSSPSKLVLRGIFPSVLPDYWCGEFMPITKYQHNEE